ncbi:hypothetical protein [Arthrobacter sp. zg-Y1171]|uniref:hypothetical protein n=1 Tax=Arthrobacter sp. zg-Y1171 TaxID=2964610 RepID=UPI0021032C33|nr:hypothetical protein [Arthrobacter sp. zg-Y1171]MCQ1994929.1 hypothetical protein [Arthrobacter sp. zg-Y1171]UWX81008.1 hypothetical protein N2L00_11410 [Arthrobacter sp. zg-Y1171]
MSEQEHNNRNNSGPDSGQQTTAQNDGAGGPVPGIPQPPVNPWAQQAPPPPGLPQPPVNPWAQQQGNAWTQPPAAPGYAPPASAWEQPNPYRGGPLPQPGYTPPPKPGIIPLRPLGLGEILDGAFQACRRNALAAFGNAFVVQAVITLLVVGLGAGFFVSVDGWLQSGSASGEVTGPVLGTVVGAVSTLGGLSLAGVLIVQGLLVLPVVRSILNLRTGFGQVWRLARGSLGPLAGLALLMLAGAAVGVTVLAVLVYLIIDTLGAAGLLVVIPALFAVVAAVVWVSVKLSLAPAALVLEGIGVFPAIRRSWRLTGRNWWRTFGIMALTSLIVNVLSQVLTVPLSFAASMLTLTDSTVLIGVSVVLIFAFSLLLTAVACGFQSAVTALLYVDLRIRREGFDLALMKDQENPQAQDSDFLPGRNAVPMARNTPHGPPAGMK